MLTVIVGGMFAEKSTELQRRGKRLKRAGKEIMFFKPDFDVRYSTDELVTHDGQSVKAFNIPTKNPDILLGIDLNEVDALLIDEVQFISSDIFFVIECLLSRYPDLQIIVAGLDMDFEGRPFNTTSWLMASAEEVIKLKAVCNSCGTDSWVSFKEPNGQRIQLGSDEYKPLCRKCFNQKLQGAN
jgi:thymidine kinase